MMAVSAVNAQKSVRAVFIVNVQWRNLNTTLMDELTNG
jgi:hypothetical protein